MTFVLIGISLIFLLLVGVLLIYISYQTAKEKFGRGKTDFTEKYIFYFIILILWLTTLIYWIIMPGFIFRLFKLIIEKF